MEPDGQAPAIPIERMIAILKYRGMDADALLLAQQRNLQALIEASDVVARGMQEISARQAGMLRDSMDRAREAVPEPGRYPTLRDLTLQQIGFARSSVAATLDNFQELSGMVWRCNRQAFDTINKSILDGLQGMLKVLPEAGSGTADPDGKEKAGGRR